MALVFYVDGAGGQGSDSSDDNGGSSLGAPLATGAGAVTDGTATVDLSADTPDLSGVSVGDTIRIASRTDGINSTNIYEITAVDDGSDTVDVTPSPGAASTQSWSIGGSWQTMDRAANVTSAGDKVWVKDATYAETVTLDNAGTSESPIVWEGYTTTPGDGGKVTIDGDSTRSTCLSDSLGANLRVHTVFKNFIFTGATAYGVQSDQVHLHFYDCEFSNNGGSGANVRGCNFLRCAFSSNGDQGAFVSGANTAWAFFHGCTFYGNATRGLQADECVILFCCRFFSNGSAAIDGAGNSDVNGLLCVLNCTIDGDNEDSTEGIKTDPLFDPVTVVMNTIIYDCGVGVSSNFDGENKLSLHNLLNSNTTDYSGYGTLEGEVTDAPDFQDEASQNYQLNTTSPAIDTGIDAGLGRMDIGAFQTVAASGGTGQGGAVPPFYPLTPGR